MDCVDRCSNFLQQFLGYRIRVFQYLETTLSCFHKGAYSSIESSLASTNLNVEMNLTDNGIHCSHKGNPTVSLLASISKSNASF